MLPYRFKRFISKLLRAMHIEGRKSSLVWRPVNRIVCLLKHYFPSAVDLFQNTVRVGRPTIRGWVKVMLIKEAENVCHQGADTAKTARANHLACNFPKEAFDQVKPG